MSITVETSLQTFASRIVRQVLIALAVFALAGSWTRAADEPAGPGAETTAVEEEHGAHEKGLPLYAVKISDQRPISPTNSMIVTWLVGLGIIIFARIATRNIKEVPEGAQNFWEFLVEGLRNFLESIIGRELILRTFWFFATVFIFILATNWCGLIPGVGTIGWGTPNEMGRLDHITRPLFRGANADLNMTGAMAMIFFVCWIYWAISSNGVGGAIVHIFGNPARKQMTGLLKFVMGIVFIAVGLLEIISILFRPVSLSFRLFGNIFAGENVLESMSRMVPGLGWLIPVPFYFMELLVGLVQALVFMLLTAVFTLLICKHDEEHDQHSHAAH
ncbi:MAG TPA: F0F1 ATP synthase subunit A [Chthoniobacteraceae bacterium]|nr:F0F1 ATP synthase subunit A [Chthoniobacteraceae bacterium]